MDTSIDDQVIDFYYALFDRIFSQPFRARITQRLRRDTVIRQVDDAAGAASQSLTRFFINQQLTAPQVAGILVDKEAEAYQESLDLTQEMAEAPVHLGPASREGVISELAKVVVYFYDWLSGPAMTKRDRLHRDIAESNNGKFVRGPFL